MGLGNQNTSVCHHVKLQTPWGQRFPCLGLCSINWEYSKAPYVKIDDEVVAEATVEKVLEALDRKLGK